MSKPWAALGAAGILACGAGRADSAPGDASGPEANEAAIDDGSSAMPSDTGADQPAIDAGPDESVIDTGVDESAIDAEAGAPSPSCGPDSVAGISIASLSGNNPLDPLGYPPYALDGCTLVYASSSGDLRLRNLSTGEESPLAPASDQPRRPAIAGNLVAWEAVVGGKSIVRASVGGQTTTLAGPFDRAGEPRVTNDAIVFTVWLTPDDAGDDTDVYLFLPGSADLVPVATGWGQQRFADVSASSVAVSDFSEDPTGAFSDTTHRNADIVVFDRGTLAKTVRHLAGKQAFPMLGVGDRLAYLDWGFVTPEPKFSAYVIRSGTVAADPTTDGNVNGSGQVTVTVNTPWTRPSVHGDWVEWIDDSAGGGGLFARPLDLSAPAESTLGGLELLGPVAGKPLTVAATTGQPFLLRGVAR
jgi:hypothetical protein